MPPPPTTRRLSLAAALLTTLAFAQHGPGVGRGGPNHHNAGADSGIFQTSVPAHPLDVILSRPTTSSVTLSLLAYADTSATLAYTPDGAARPLSLKAGHPQSIDITSLAPDSIHEYSIAAPGQTTINGAFRTARAPGQNFIFNIQACSHLDENTSPAVYTNTLRNIAADHPDLFFDLGDTFMVDKYPTFPDAAPQYLAQRYYLGIPGSSAAVFLTLGNHDGEQGWHDHQTGMSSWANAMRLRYFPPVTSNAFYSAGPTTANYYAFTWGDALFVVLDPFTQSTQKPHSDSDGWQRTLGRTQYDWLAHTLSTSHARYKFVFIHHLVGGLDKDSRGGIEASTFFEWGGNNLDGTPGFAHNRPGWPQPIHQLLVANHVTAVFHGHDHLYVRQQRDGILYLEVPQPSAAREDQTSSAADYGYHSGILLGSPGHIRVTVSPNSATVEYVKSRLTGRNAQVADRTVLHPTQVAP